MFSKRKLMLLLAASVMLSISSVPSAAQDNVSYPPFDQRCTESQIKQYLEQINYPDRTGFVSLALEVCNERADPTLAKFLGSPNSDLRSLAAYGWALTHTDRERAIVTLIASLKNENTSVRSRSVYALGEVFEAKIPSESRQAAPKKVLEALTAALGDRERLVRVRAATSLIKSAQSFPELAPILISALKDQESSIRLTAVLGLGRVGKDFPSLVPSILPAVIAALRDRDDAVRSVAAEVLGEIGKDPNAVVPALRGALKDKHPKVRVRTAEALKAFGSAASPAIPDLIAALKEAQAEDSGFSSLIHVSAESALVRIGSASVPALIDALKNENARSWAIAALGAFGKDSRAAVPALRALMADEDVGNRAAVSIRKIANEAAEVLPVLIDALQDKNPIVRSHAADGLVFLEGSSRAIPSLIGALRRSELDIRAEAILTLGRTGAQAILPLTEALHDQDVHVRAGAALAFWRMARGRPYALRDINFVRNAVPALRAALRDPEQVVRYRAILALKDTSQDAKDLPPLPVSALRDEDRSVRARAAYDLIGTDPKLTNEIISILIADFGTRGDFDPTYRLTRLGKDAVPFLIAALKDPNSRIRAGAALELSDMKQVAQPAIPALILALADKDRDVHNAAAFSLEEIGGKSGIGIRDAIPALILALKTWDKRDRPSLIEAFVRVGKYAVPALSAALQDDDSEVRLFVVDVLARMDRDVGAALPFLIKALSDPNPKVRLAVVHALGNVAHESFQEFRDSSSTSQRANPAIRSLIEALEDKDPEVRLKVALLLRDLAEYVVHDLTSALEDRNALVRKGAAFALENVKSLPANAVDALKTMVENKKEDLEVRRVAASTLDRYGLDMRSFFQKNNLIAPKDALCPKIPLGQGWYSFRFDDYVGRCINEGYSGYDSGGASLFDYIKKLFGGK